MTEQHPLFPSGEWEGFYMYGAGTKKEEMQLSLEFSNRKVRGSGTDPIGPFSFDGKYDVGAGTCQMTKNYPGQHSVYYDGVADENGIWGKWTIAADLTGGFHIWPKKTPGNEEEAEISKAMAISGQVTIITERP